MKDLTLTVYIDFKSPDAYLALDPTLALQLATGVQIDWLPFSTELTQDSSHQSRPATDDGFEDFKLRRQRVKDNYTLKNKVRYAQLLDLSEEDIHRSCDSTMASMGLLWLKDDSQTLVVKYIRGVFEMFFRAHRNIGSFQVVNDVINAIGADTWGFDRFVANEGRRMFEKIQQQVSELGLYATPAYVFKGERFQGREHIPLIKWYLSGRKGAPPV